jgi:hypothetical protein
MLHCASTTKVDGADPGAVEMPGVEALAESACNAMNLVGTIVTLVAPVDTGLPSRAAARGGWPQALGAHFCHDSATHAIISSCIFWHEVNIRSYHGIGKRR